MVLKKEKTCLEYLFIITNRLLDPINLMFAPSDSEAEFPETPSAEEVENVIKALQQELVVGAFDASLVKEGSSLWYAVSPD